MFTAYKSSNKKLQRRRNFLSRSAVAVGGMALLGASTGPAHALAKATTGNQDNPGRSRKIVQPGNATVTDFTDLVGQRFRLQTEGGKNVDARLIEANSPPTRRALRFRREQFSLVFDVPGSLELLQERYRLSHPQIGSMVLFMVPVDLPAVHNRLEAIFA